MPYDGGEQLFAAAEVVVDDAAAVPGEASDLGQRDRPGAVAGDQRGGGVEDALLGLGPALLLGPALTLACHGRHRTGASMAGAPGKLSVDLYKRWLA